MKGIGGCIFKRSRLIFQYISGTFNFLIIFTLFKLKAPTSSKSGALFEISVALFEIKIAILRFEGCFFHEHLKFSNALFNFFIDPFSWSRLLFKSKKRSIAHFSKNQPQTLPTPTPTSTPWQTLPLFIFYNKQNIS